MVLNVVSLQRTIGGNLGHVNKRLPTTVLDWSTSLQQIKELDFAVIKAHPK